MFYSLFFKLFLYIFCRFKFYILIIHYFLLLFYFFYLSYWFWRCCLSSLLFALFHIDRFWFYKKLLVLSSSLFPKNSLSNHFWFLLLNIIILSLSFLIYWSSSAFNCIYWESNSSPSNTEIWICTRYFLHVLNTFRNISSFI